MLYLYQSNRLEELAAMMAAMLRQRPLRDALAPEQVVVQSQGMRRYLNRYLAQELGIAANMRFYLPAALSWRLMREHLAGVPELSPFSAEVMRWRLLELFRSAAFAREDGFQAAYAVLSGYLANGPFAAYELAGVLADIFDQYLVYRPDWIEAWSAGRTAEGLGCDAAMAGWQAALWRYLDNGHPLPHRVQLWRDLSGKLAEPDIRLPERYFVFGMATLAPMYLHLLKQLAQRCEVHILALNPSEGFWGDVADPAQILRDGGEADETRQGHPLLASLGKQGRDFFNELAEIPCGGEQAAFAVAPPSNSLLHSLQYHIQTLTLPQQARREQGWPHRHAQYLQHEVWPQQPQSQTVFQAALPEHIDDSRDSLQAVALAQLKADDSIRIHAAHSPLRELQILKQRLDELLARHPELQPHDIAVLTPDIEPYAPFIEAVFGAHTPFGRPLPYSTADVKISRSNQLLQGLAQVLSLIAGRFESDALLPLLDNALIRARFGIARDDLPLLHDLVDRLNIHWGADRGHRAEFGDDSSLFTWQQGLERLIAGWMLPEHNGLWQNISPHPVRPEQIETTARLAALVHTLTDARNQWQEPTDIAGWCIRVRELCDQLFAADSDHAGSLQLLQQALSQWQQQADLAAFRLPVERDTALAHLHRFLDTSSEAGFLRHGITFCSMVPMRSLPFAVLCLIGLNDGAFPRQTPVSPFDLIGRHPRKGDRARRDDDRYLFLEAILSARRYLHLSYVGRDIRNDEERAPSVLISELADTVAAMSGVPAQTLAEHWIIRHPLQAFSPRYFSSNPLMIGNRHDYAAALNQAAPPPPPFLAGLAEAETDDQPDSITQRDFIRFWRNPVRVWLQDTLNWQTPHAEAGFDAAEPFNAARPRQLDNAYVAARRDHQDFDALAQQLSAQSLLPAGLLGRLTADEQAAAAKQLDARLLNSPPQPVQSGILTLSSGSLNYRLDNRTADGQLLFAERFLRQHNQHGRLNADDKIELLLRHLIACAASGAQPTHFVSLRQSVSLPPLEQEAARAALDLWLAAYRQGRRQPLPFFPRVNYAAAVALYAQADDTPDQRWARAEAAAADKYHKGYNGFAQEDYNEVRLVYGRDEEPPYRSQTFRRLTENLFAPLSTALAVLERSMPEEDDADMTGTGTVGPFQAA